MVETGHKFHDNVSRLISWGHWFTFFNILLASLISLRYIAYAGLSESGLGIAYQFTSLIGHFSFLSAMVFGVVFFPLAFIIPFQRLYRLCAIVISTAAITFLILDTQIFRLYNFHLNPLIWQFLQRPEQVEQIYSINLHYISIPIIFLLELAISFFVWRKCRFLHAKAIGKPIAIFLFATFVITHLTFIWADATQYRPITQQKSIYPLSYPMTARSFLKKQGWLSEDKLLSRINRPRESKEGELHYPIAPLTYLEGPSVAAKNILLITVDALRADMVNEKNMPFMHQLSQQGLTYQHHFSGASNRPQGLFSLFYALPNRYWPEITVNYIPPVLISRLAQQNYQFGLFSSIGFLHPEFLQSSFSELRSKELQNNNSTNNNSSITRSWKKWLNKQNNSQKWFSFLHYEQVKKLQSHHSASFSIAAQEEKLSLYQEQMLSTDNHIKRVIATLRKKQLLENTIVIITGTHGASFEKESTIEAAISNAHVPLVMLWPDTEPQQITRMTSHLDIVPTLMQALLGSQSSADQYSSGQSLFDERPRQYLLSGDLGKYVIYERDKITQFSIDGQIDSIDWQGQPLNEEHVDITLLIDVLSKLRRFN